MSAVVLAEIVPVLLLAPLAGSLVDRLPRVRVMVLADLVRVVLAGVLALWHDSAAVAYAVAFGLSCGQVFFSPAAQSLLPSVVRDDELVAANGGIWTAAVTVVLAQDRLGGGEGFGVLVRRDRGGGRARAAAAPAPDQGPPAAAVHFGPYAVRGLVDLALAAVTAVPLAAALVFQPVDVKPKSASSSC